MVDHTATAHALNDGAILARVAVGATLGAIIGFEREWRKRSAGLQTTGLVAAGAALFCSASPALGGPTGDTMRAVAAVSQGVGFLAGGVILKDGLSVSGLNTAATIWATAAVGSLAGVGLFREASAGAIAILLLNLAFFPVAEAINKRVSAKIPPKEH